TADRDFNQSGGFPTRRDTMKKFVLAIFALVVSACFLTQRSEAATVVALELAGDPNSFFEVAASPSLDASLGSAFTIEAWVKPSGILTFPGADGQWYIILNYEDAYELGVNAGTSDSTKGTFQTAVQ